TAANCIDAIAQGLRTDFAKYQSTIVPIMIEKLKERKPAILLHLVNGLNSVFSSLSINEWLKELAQGSKHANPQVRSECLKLVSRQLREIRVIPGKPEIKTMGNMFKRALDDADANVREAAAEGLGTMLRLLDEKAMRVFTESLEDIKMTKIKEYCNKATVRISDIPTFSKKDPIKKPIIRKSVQSTPKLVQGAPKPIQSTPKPIQSTPKSIQSTPKRKLPVNATEGTPSKRPALSHTSPSSKRPEIKYVFTQEEAESRATQTIPETIYKGLQDPVWKLRLEAIDALCNHVSQNEPSIEPEIVIRLLFQKKKETNFQVMAKMFYCIQLLASHPKFTTACAALLVPSLVEKLSDVKLKKPASDCLVVLVERTSFDFLLSQTYPLLRSVKSPKVLSDALLWIHGRLMDFGVEGVQINDLVDSVKFALGNTNVTVRTNAVTVMGALRQFIGPNAISYVKDVSPALLATIEKEFDKVSKLTKPQPIKKVDMMDIDTEFSDPISTQVLPQVSAVTEVSSRVDISKQLNRAVAQCGDNNWKIRKEGLDIVQGLLSANPRLKPTLSIDFLDVLKERLNDSNKLLQIQAIEITGQLVSTMGKLFERYVRMFVDPVVNVLSDNKTHVRTAGISTLEEFRQACGMEPLIPSFGNALSNESPVLRKELLCWLNKKKLEGYDDQWISLISPLFSCIQDRNVDVRKEAQFLLPTLISLVGYEPLHRQASELKTAEKQILLPLLESFRPPESPSRTKQLKMTPSPSAVSKSPA
ncbi:stu2 protein, partial [Rhizopus stolonifer]